MTGQCYITAIHVRPGYREAAPARSPSNKRSLDSAPGSIRKRQRPYPFGEISHP